MRIPFCRSRFVAVAVAAGLALGLLVSVGCERHETRPPAASGELTRGGPPAVERAQPMPAAVRSEASTDEEAPAAAPPVSVRPAAEPAQTAVTEGGAEESRTAPPPVAAPPPPRVRSQRYLVRPGDTLMAIARKEYGDIRYAERIYAVNRDQIDDPDLIRPGQKLRLPLR